MSDFLRSKAIKRLLEEDYTDQAFQVEVDDDEQSRGQVRINALPLATVKPIGTGNPITGTKWP